MRGAFRQTPNLAQDPLSAARDRLDYERSLALFTELVGTRFRLLGLLPIVSGAVIALLGQLDVQPGLIVGPALLGLVVTAGIAVYEIRNSQIHDNLVNRLRHLERVLDLTPATHDPKAQGGFFSERATRQLYLTPATSDWSDSSDFDTGQRRIALKVRHDAGLALVYGAVLAAWVAVLIWNAVLAVDATKGAAWWASAAAALAAGSLGWLTISASSKMGRNVGRVYLLGPLAEEYSNEITWPADLTRDLMSLEVPTGLLDDDAYDEFKNRHPKVFIDFALSLGVIAHRRQLSKLRVCNVLKRTHNPKLRSASLSAIVGAREVDAAGDFADARRVLILRYGAQSAWCTDSEVALRVAWLEHLSTLDQPPTHPPSRISVSPQSAS